MIDTVVFDLDNTLYEHAEFVRGAYQLVAEDAARSAPISTDAFFAATWPQWQLHGSTRTDIFANALRELGCYSPELEGRLVQAYRSHRPASLNFYEGATSVLDQLHDADLKLGVLTDGQTEVQRAKLAALRPNDWFRAFLCTGELGREYYKPHEAGFRRIVEMLGATFNDTVYVGDNPRTDFVTPKKLGMTTVRVLTGEYAALPSPEGVIDHTCDDLSSASRWLLRHVHPCAS